MPARSEAARRRWGDLGLRLLSGAVLMPVALLLLWAGGLAWDLLVLLAGGLAAIEWVRLCRPLRPKRRWPVLAAGVICIAPGTIALIWLRTGAAGLANVLFVLLVVWAGDIGAYLAGRAFGGPRLAPRISPGKTWSGAGGGLLAAMAVAFAFAVSLGPAWRALPVAAILSVAAQGGDLMESAIKRGFGVKDSGHLIPGHGGVLDRIDALLTAAPLAALLALRLGHGVHLWQ